jgi:hypothetical protein
MPKQPISDPTAPDEYGRLRVRDVDTGHERSIHATELPHGNYVLLDEPASHPLTGEALPPVHKSLSGPTTPAKQADTEKENTDG